MTKQIAIGIFAVLFMSGISHFWILNPDDLQPGSELIGHVGIWNNDDDELKNIELTFEIIGTDVFDELGRFEILPQDNYGKYFFIQLPDYLQPGDYIVKTHVCSKNCRSLEDTRYNFITVQ